MIRKFLDKLAEAASPARKVEDPAAGAQLAAAALLVDAARSDQDYSEEEKRLIDRLLAEAYALSPEAAAALRARGEEAQAASVDRFRFTRVLKDAIEPESRAAFLEQMWRVVLADGRRDPNEDQLMRKLAGLLYVTDPENAAARQRAEAAIRSEQ